MNLRRTLLTLLGAAALADPCGVLGQGAKPVPKIGYLDPFGQGQPDSDATRAAFAAGLRELGWVEGRNLTIEYRSAFGKPDQYASIAMELIRLKVNVVVTGGDQLTAATRKATATIPIVTSAVGDPIAAGLAASLARPGGNVTGLSNLAAGLPGKWLELVRESVPRTTRVAALRNLGHPTHTRFWEETVAAATKLGVVVHQAGYRTSADMESALAAAASQKAQALLVFPDPMIVVHGALIADFLTRNRMPSVFLAREQALAGGLFSYGPSRTENFRRAATFVDKILRGANPADLPFEQPTRFELVINMKTAKALGITIPQSILVRADRVIE